MDTIYFFVSDIDLCSIFEKIEQEFDLKYCAELLYSGIGDSEKPRIEFDTIGEITDDLGTGRLGYLIAQKSEEIHTFCRNLEHENKIQYNTYYDKNRNSVSLRGGKKYPDMLEDYQVHFAKEFESEFAAILFKRIVRQVKQNCTKVKNNAPFYVGNEIYKSKEDYVFYGMRFAFPLIITKENEVKRWWRNQNVMQFTDKPLIEELDFLREIFADKKLQNYADEYNNRTEDYEKYEAVMYKLAINNDLSLLKDIVTLFDESVKVRSPFCATKTAMEELRDMVIDLAFSKKTDGITILLESLKYVPAAGYHCGCKGNIKILQKKKYLETFKESLLEVTDETKKLVEKLLAY